MSDAIESAEPALAEETTAPKTKTGKFDRAIVEGPLGRAVWKIAWPTVLTNAIGGLQGLVDHALVGNMVGIKGRGRREPFN